MGIDVQDLQDKFAILDFDSGFYAVGNFFGITEKSYNVDDKLVRFFRVGLLIPLDDGEFDILNFKINSDDKGLYSLESTEIIQFLTDLAINTPVCCQIKQTAYKSGDRAQSSYKLLKILAVGKT